MLAEFSGYIAADELYDGRFCVLSIVDNRTFRRIAYEVLDHTPTQADVESFFRAFQTALSQRGLVLRGITTDGSFLYPEPIAKVFGHVAHQICEFHVLRKLAEGTLHALAKIRKALTASKPPIGRGRPCSARARRTARRRLAIDRKVHDLYEHRHLFVRRSLSPDARRKLSRLARGQPALRTLREIMDQVYGLFDRRCRMETALAKLSRLRCRVRRFQWIGRALQKLYAPSLHKALTFLDDRLLPSTGNAVERSNRRHRKMQNSIYRVRTVDNLRGRIALDLHREQRAQPRSETTKSLHAARLLKAA